MPDKKETVEERTAREQEETAAAVDAAGWEQLNKPDYEKVVAGEVPSFQEPVEEDDTEEVQPEQLK